jgi:molybdopterin-guanine dinucleotide biosynthesis protein MobB
MNALAHIPVFAICGYSGAGKTTLILELVRRLNSHHLRTVVIKHDTHGLAVDHPGKDTHRFFTAGADVIASDHAQSFCRRHDGDGCGLATLIPDLARDYDVILVEGHKTTPLPRKLWLRRHARDRAPRACGKISLDLGCDGNRVAAAWTFIERELATIHWAAPTLAGILIGGQSQRMGRAKHLLLYRGRTWLARIADAVAPVVDSVVLLGARAVPRSCRNLPILPDVPDISGPLAGMYAAFRWRPNVRWIFLSCDTPLVTTEALRWLMTQSRPGLIAVQPRLGRGSPPQPFPGWYDPRAARTLETARGPSWLAKDPRVYKPVAPRTTSHAWWNCNSPVDLRKLPK